jgi:hypothetical protein
MTDDWDNLVAGMCEKDQPLAQQMVRVIRELNSMCGWADALFEGDSPGEGGYNWRAAWRVLND